MKKFLFIIVCFLLVFLSCDYLEKGTVIDKTVIKGYYSIDEYEDETTTTHGTSPNTWTTTSYDGARFRDYYHTPEYIILVSGYSKNSEKPMTEKFYVNKETFDKINVNDIVSDLITNKDKYSWWNNMSKSVIKRELYIRWSQIHSYYAARDYFRSDVLPSWIKQRQYDTEIDINNTKDW